MIKQKFLKLSALRKILLVACACMFTLSLFAQQSVTVTGTVTGTDDEVIVGVNILEKGAINGAMTDANGNFTLSVSANAVLQVSFLGYITQEISVSSYVAGTKLAIKLVEDTEALDEVVVVGYGTQKRVNLTGSVDVISGERLTNRPSGNVSQAIRGLSPGLNFSAGSAFQPGADMSVTIRGIGSLNGGSPYILVDGFPGDMNLLNPDDVESISVLKDASASAIYGARAPYGVILITTKSGKRKEKMHVTYSGNVMINTPQKLPEQLDSWTYSRVQNEAGRNSGGSPMTEAAIDRIIAFQNQDWNLLHQLLPNYPAGADIKSGAYANGNEWDSGSQGFANNDWYDILYGYSVNQKHDVSLQGGTDKTGYYFSGGYLGTGGVLNYTQDDFSRINLMGKVNVAIADWWDFAWDTRFAQKERIRSAYASGVGGSYDSMMSFLTRWIYPFSPLYDGYGNISRASNAVFFMQGGLEKVKNLDYWNNFKTEIRLLKGWKVNADFAYNTQNELRSVTRRTIYQYGAQDNLPIVQAESQPTSIERRLSSRYYWNTNIYTSYTLDLLDAHHFYLMAGMQLEKSNYNDISGRKNDLLVESVPSFQTATGVYTLYESLSHNATQGYFGRFTYNYKEKYLFEANARYDGSYVFREGNRWGFFPSASLGWNAHKESFWTAIEPYVNTFKIKASWGQLGNQNVSPYTDLELIPLQTGQLNWIFDYGSARPVGYTTAPGIVNQNLTWETATTKNLGFETSFLQNKLQVNFDVYERITTNMIGPSEAKPGVLGASVPSTNNATLRTRGWDLSVGWKQNINRNLSWFANANLTNYSSVVTMYNNPTGTLSSWYEGETVGEIWGYSVNDLYRTQAELDSYVAATDLTFMGSTWKTGDVKYEDTNGDTKVDNGKNTISDHGDMSIIGNNHPHYIFGLTLGLNYKGLDFSMLWSGILKKQVYFGQGADLYWGFHNDWWEAALSTRNLDYYRDEPGTKYYGLYEGEANINTNAYWPRPYLNWSEQRKNQGFANTRYLMNAAFARLTNLQVGYSLPQHWISKLKLEKVRVFFSGDNLITLTKLPPGIDPEAINGSDLNYGADRIYSFGITITY